MERVAFSSTSNDFSMTKSGRIDPIKGIDTLLEAFAHVSTQHLGTLLAIVGGDLDENDEPVGPLAAVKREAEEDWDR